MPIPLSEDDSHRVHVRFVDGVEVWIPVSARQIDDRVYEILPSPEFDEADNSLLWEFGPGEQVTVSPFDTDETTLAARSLVREFSTTNIKKRLQYHIISEGPSPYALGAAFGWQPLLDLCDELEAIAYPAIRDWLVGNERTIRSSSKGNESA